MNVRTCILLVCLLKCPACAQEPVNPYRCEGTAHDIGRNLSLVEVRERADQLAKSGYAVDLCTAAELYKRLGDPKAHSLYERAIGSAPDEPAYEWFYGEYLRLYRGAGERPLFQEAEKHLFAARGKLLTLHKTSTLEVWRECSQKLWNKCTEERVQRSLTALYERDGFHLAEWTWKAEGSRDVVQRPWLFFSPGMRYEHSNNDLDRTADVRDRTSEEALSASRLNRPLTQAELEGLVRLMTPTEGSGRVRIRYQSAPIIDVFATWRKTANAQVTNFGEPDRFNDFKLRDFGVTVDKPFAISGNTDADVRFTYHHVNREGLIESLPQATESINQYEAEGAFSQYLGPDRLNLSYVYVRQSIIPEPANLQRRDREITGGTATYQIFRPLPLPGRNLETGLGRRFETRGIDVFGGVLNDNERYPASPVDVFVTRGDYFAGIAVRGLNRFDVTLQPTWFTSSVSNDRTQYNSQLRLAGNVLFRVLDEERTGGMPKERFLGLPVAFVQVVVPFHWDTPREGSGAFRSRKLGAELWTKFFSASGIGVTILGEAGYSRQWFPALNRNLNLVRFGVSVGF
jgi:hypothetical protein